MLPLIVAIAGSAHASGSSIFAAHCAVCHRLDGKGVPGTYPPLAGSVGNYVRIPDGRQYLVHVVSFGMMGPISVKGRTYNGLMQSWNRFSDDDVTQVLNHVLMDLNGRLLPKDFKPLTPDEVRRLRATSASFFDVHNERDRLMKALEGSSIVAPKAPRS
jgi:mono/diheme cytochrome c family protein